VWGLRLSYKRNQLPLFLNWGLTRRIPWTKWDNTFSSIIQRVIQRSVEINSRTVSIMSGVQTAVGCPLRWSSSRFSRPSRNLAYNSKTHVQERPFSI
jgi:hypothetical protein